MNILFTVCARAGSKGVKSKNSRNFLGVPIAYYTIASYLLFMKNNMYEYGIVDLALNTDSDILVEQFNCLVANYQAHQDDLKRGNFSEQVISSIQRTLWSFMDKRDLESYKDKMVLFEEKWFVCIIKRLHCHICGSVRGGES